MVSEINDFCYVTRHEILEVSLRLENHSLYNPLYSPGAQPLKNPRKTGAL